MLVTSPFCTNGGSGNGSPPPQPGRAAKSWSAKYIAPDSHGLVANTPRW